MSHGEDARRRTRAPSLWLLAVALLLGVAIVVAALVVASLVRTSSPDKRTLDSLAAQTRLVTPAGTREIRTTRFACGERADSAPPTVVRELDAGHRSANAAANEVVTAYLAKGWHTIGTGSAQKDKLTADVVATGSALTVEVADFSEAC